MPAGDPPSPTVVAAPTEEALQQLSEAQKLSSSGHPSHSGRANSSSSVTAQLSHSSSTLTNSSSIYTASMSSADTVLPRLSVPPLAQSGGLRKRPAAETASFTVSSCRHTCPDPGKGRSALSALTWDLTGPMRAFSRMLEQQAKGGEHRSKLAPEWCLASDECCVSH